MLARALTFCMLQQPFGEKLWLALGQETSRQFRASLSELISKQADGDRNYSQLAQSYPTRWVTMVGFDAVFQLVYCRYQEDDLHGDAYFLSISAEVALRDERWPIASALLNYLLQRFGRPDQVFEDVFLYRDTAGRCLMDYAAIRADSHTQQGLAFICQAVCGKLQLSHRLPELLTAVDGQRCTPLHHAAAAANKLALLSMFAAAGMCQDGPTLQAQLLTTKNSSQHSLLMAAVAAETDSLHDSYAMIDALLDLVWAPA